MRFYLSSYEVGDKTEQLKMLVPAGNKKTAYIGNARDFTAADPVRRTERNKSDMAALKQLGLEVELLDLKQYFGKKVELKQKIEQLGVLWVSGGNVFVLRQAMKLSGLDEIIIELQQREDFLYGGYSAGCCVLTPSLKPYAIVDDATDTPYDGIKEVLWDGLGILDFAFLPHYDSDHPESADVDKEIKNCIEKKILFKAFRDGEVLIIE